MSDVYEILFTILTSCPQPIQKGSATCFWVVTNQLRDIGLNDLAHFSKVCYRCEHADDKFLLLSQNLSFNELTLKSHFGVDTFRFRPTHNRHKHTLSSFSR